MNTCLDTERLVLASKKNGVSLYLFRPTIFKPLLFDYERMTIKRRLRYFRNYCRRGKYVVYYLALDKDKSFVGLCAVTPGGRGLKIQCTHNNDIILGPYYVEPTFRGKGYGKAMINMVLDCNPYNYNYAYDIIAKDNIPSVHTSKACGFEKYQEINLVGLLKKHAPTDNGEYIIFRRHCK